MILVTGGNGFVGARLVARLVAEGERPRALVRAAATSNGWPAESVEIVTGDTTRPATLDAAVAGVATIIHTAFVTADRKERTGVNYYATNVEGTANLVAAAKRAGVGRIIVLSGLGTVPARPGSYMQGRYLAVQEVRNSGLAYSILGPSILFGPGAAFFKGLADLIRKVPVVPMIGSGSRRFQPVYVEDVVTCLLKMAREPEQYDGKSIDIGGPDILTYARILDLLMDTLHIHKPKVPGPTPFAYLGAAVMEALLPKPPITVAALGLFAFDNTTDLDSVPRHFGFAPAALAPYLAEHGLN
jgi:NADH dehydrogenase